ncbi:hypothetical protein CA833_09650 [Novosphingobium sp. KA1]|nr:hypothetical protein CA833_09650 [Novosphingobium sp. KA1]
MAHTQAQHNWQTYGNARFGYSVCYPADLLRPQREADNGDGRVFVGPHGATLRVWGGYNAVGDTVAQAKSDAAKRFVSQGYTVTYQVSRPEWFVLSGAGKGKTFYQRTMLNKDREVSFVLEYPASDAAIWNPVSAKLSHCLAG